MFEDLLLFLIVIIGNLVVWFIIRNLKFDRKSVGGIIYRTVGILGIFIHELAHFAMCLLTGVRPSGFHLSYRGQEGGVSYPKMERVTFLQGFLICFAPLLISSYVAYLCIYVMFLTTVVFLYKFLCAVVFVSILMHSRPSRQDLAIFKGSFSNDPQYSVYQVGLVVISGVIVFLLNFPLPYYLSFIHYILIGVFYTVFKYSLLGIRKGYDFIAYKRGRDTRRRSPSNPYRVRNKPKLPKRERVPRRQW